VGLALCRAVVGAHGGSIRAETTPGGGATLVVRLPLPEAVGRGEATAASAGAAAGRRPRAKSPPAGAGDAAGLPAESGPSAT
jgi:hypothetical protein